MQNSLASLKIHLAGTCTQRTELLTFNNAQNMMQWPRELCHSLCIRRRYRRLYKRFIFSSTPLKQLGQFKPKFVDMKHFLLHHLTN